MQRHKRALYNDIWKDDARRSRRGIVLEKIYNSVGSKLPSYLPTGFNSDLKQPIVLKSMVASKYQRLPTLRISHLKAAATDACGDVSGDSYSVCLVLPGHRRNFLTLVMSTDIPDQIMRARRLDRTFAQGLATKVIMAKP